MEEGKMIYRVLLFCFFLLFAGSPNARAGDVLGNLRIGWMPMANYNLINDPEGPTNDNVHFMPLCAVIIYNNILRDARLFGNIYYDSYSVSAESQHIAQSVTEFGVNVSYQWMFRVSRVFKPYLGIGLGYAAESFKNRYNTTPDGLFLNTTYPNRSVQAFNAVVNASSEWQLSPNWNVGVHLQFEQPIGGGLTAIRAGMYITY